MATGHSYRDLHFAFRVGVSTLSGLIPRTLEAIWDVFSTVHIRMPSKDDFCKSAAGFSYHCGVEHCLGAIDGRHINIKRPNGTGSEFYNYKNYFSIVLLAVVDFFYRFIFIDVGGYGSHSDGGILAASDFFRALKEDELEIPETISLPGSDFELPYFFVADAAFPLSERIMKPFPGKNLPAEAQKYNKRISCARVKVENAFAFVCQKWRIFYTTIQLEPHVVDWIVKCTCLLHNILIDLGDVNMENFVFDDELDVVAAPFITVEQEDEEIEAQVGPQPGNAKIMREFLVKYFNSNPFQQKKK